MSSYILNTHLCKKLCERMCSMRATQDQLTPKQTSTATGQSRGPLPILPPHYGLYHQSTTLKWIWLNHGHGRPWIFKGGNSRILPQDRHCCQNHRNFITNHLQKIWITWQSNIQSRTTVHFPCIQGIRMTLRNQTCHEHGTPLPNRWSNQKI